MSHQEPKPQKINRMDPAWAMFAAAYLPVKYKVQEALGENTTVTNMVNDCADFADAMLRERDRRDREERE